MGSVSEPPAHHRSNRGLLAIATGSTRYPDGERAYEKRPYPSSGEAAASSNVYPSANICSVSPPTSSDQ